MAIKYRVRIGGVLLTNDVDGEEELKGANADIEEIRISQAKGADGQEIDLKICNKFQRYTGMWAMQDAVNILLIEERWVYSGGSLTKHRTVFPVCKGIVQHVEYDVHYVTIKAAISEDDFASSHPDNEYTVNNMTISQAVEETLKHYKNKGIIIEDIIIDIDNDLKLFNVQYTSNQTFREILDDLAWQAKAEWWTEVMSYDLSGTHHVKFYFVSTDKSVVPDAVDYSWRATQPSYGLNMVGYVNDVTVIGGGNEVANVGELGVTVFHTVTIRGTYQEQLAQTNYKLDAPAFYIHRLNTPEQCERAARNISLATKDQDLNIAHPEFVGGYPLLTERISYSMNSYEYITGVDINNDISDVDITISGTVIAKEINFSASGWICKVDLNKVDGIAP